MDEKSRIDERIDEVLERVQRGEHVTLHRGGEAVARVLPPEATAASPRGPDVKEDMARLRSRIRLGGLRFRDLAHEGHRY